MTARRSEDQLDTYLLRMFCLLVTERSVSRTALKLNQSQPAVSLALKRLREILGDPLLVREKSGMVPTERALTLLSHAKGALAEIDRMTDTPESFDPQVSRHEFRVGAPDYLAPVFIAIAAVVEPQSLGIVAALGDAIPAGNRLELFLGAAIGAITFSGSVIAFGKLSGKYKFRLFQGAPVQFAGQHKLNLLVGLAIIALGLYFTFTGNIAAFALLVALAFVIGVLIIIPIGGADMPVVVSMLNSYSGWAAAGIGFSLNNSMLIIAGSLVGSSGAILSYIMCKAMNRSFFNVILGGFGGEAGGPAAGAAQQRNVKSGSADDAAFVLGNAETVVIEKRESSSRPDRGVVTVESRGFNQRGEEVCFFRRKVMVPKRDAAAPRVRPYTSPPE